MRPRGIKKRGFLSIATLILIAFAVVVVASAAVYLYPSTSHQSHNLATGQSIPTSTLTTSSASTFFVPSSTNVVSATTTVILPPSCTFSANPSTILPLTSAMLVWNCKNADTCSITDTTTGSKVINETSTQGTLRVSPNPSASYTLLCTGVSGATSSNVANVAVQYSNTPNCPLGGTPCE